MNEGVPVNELAFDTATAACSVALRRADGEVFEHRPPASRLLEQPGHTTELLPAVLTLTEAAEVELSEIGRIAVGVGPGAFTGLRIGVATARAIATANGIGLTPVSSLAALGGEAVTPLVDARRGEIYFRVQDCDLLAERSEAVASVAAAGLPAVGDGAIKLRDELEATGIRVADDADPVHVVSAARILDLAASLEPIAPDLVVPNYIRPPDAKVSSRESWLVGATK